jgi:hypothetical protein
MKYINRLRSRLAVKKLAESKNAWIVAKDMKLVTESGDMELKKGSLVQMFATKNGHLAVKESGVTIILDDEVADKVADNTVSAAELGDVKFVKKSALDAALDGETVEDLVAGLVDGEEDSDDVERAEVDAEQKESVESKFAKLEASERISEDGALQSDEVLIADEPDSPIDLGSVEADTVNKEEFADYEEFKNRISELEGALQPGAKEIALKGDKVIGYFDTEANAGVVYPDMAFDSEEEMNNFSGEPEALVQPAEFESCLGEEALVAVEESLKAYEESDKSGVEYMTFVESLAKAGLEESVIGKVANSFVSRNLAEGTVTMFDTKVGSVVRSFKENVEANQFAADAKEEARFTKRFIA